MFSGVGDWQRERTTVGVVTETREHSKRQVGNVPNGSKCLLIGQG